MATVINNPGGDNDSGVGTIIGVIIAVILLFVLIRWGIPAMRGDTNGGANVNIEVPSTNSSSTE